MALFCFRSKEEIVQRILRLSTSAPDFLHAQMLARFLGEVRAARIPGYKHALVSLNVAPPIMPKGGGPINSGMDPQAITDPEARAAYERAIAENDLRNYGNEFQLTLSTINHTITANTLNYIRRLFIANPKAKDQMDRLAELGHLTKEERDQLSKGSTLQVGVLPKE
jgi:hypothetical protein